MIYIYYRQYREDLYAASSRDPSKVSPSYYSPSLCLFSILDSIHSNGLREHFRVVIWYDGTQEDFDSDPINGVISRFAAHIDLFKIRENFRGIGDNSSEKISGPALLRYCTDHHSSDDYVYLVENDYLHDLRSMPALKAITELEELVHFATLYDSPDYYRLNLHRKFHGLPLLVGGFPWREVLTTTGSYFTKVQTLRDDLDALLNTFDFYAFVKLVGLRGRILIAPNDSLSSHLMIGHESPIRSGHYTIKKFSEGPAQVNS